MEKKNLVQKIKNIPGRIEREIEKNKYKKNIWSSLDKVPFRDGVCWLFLTSQDKNWEGEKFHFPNFFNMCALRRTFRLRAMGALSQVKVLNMPR